VPAVGGERQRAGDPAGDRSAIMVTKVIATTHAVRRSPRVAATARSPWWAWSAGACTAVSEAVTPPV
jgi:hypothetical protein